MDRKPDNRIWKSYIWHGGRCLFVSTIERNYDTIQGTSRGQETIAWEYNWDKLERGSIVYQAGGVCDHQALCRIFINTGTLPDTDSEEFKKFR